MRKPNRQDLTGVRFGRLVVSDLYSCEKYKPRWNCICDCGGSKVVTATDLRAGDTQSCGCLHKENGHDLGINNKTHGMTNSGEFLCFKSMMNRCYTKSATSYSAYGGSGVVVAPELQTFFGFIQHMGHWPSTGNKYTLDRIDNNKGYEIGNIRWATIEEQARNKRMVLRNTSGVTGVCWAINHGTTNALAYWVEDGKRITRLFNTKKFGLIPAFSKACELRNSKIAELNAKGYGYTEDHGKNKGNL